MEVYAVLRVSCINAVVMGVFRTKDFYHTCYCLSGLSVAQHFADAKHACTHIVGNKVINELVCILLNFYITYFTVGSNVVKHYFYIAPIIFFLVLINVCDASFMYIIEDI